MERDTQGREMKHTTVTEDNGVQVLRYHATDVVTVTPNEVTLNTGGYLTATTKKRIIQGAGLFGLNLHCHAHKGEWFVTLADGRSVRYSDGMIIPREQCTAN